METKEKNIPQLIKEKIKQKDAFADIILFGSHARGQAHKDSDWDILILINREDDNRIFEKELRSEIFDIELETGEAISTFVFSKEEWEKKHYITPLYQNIKNEGIYL